MRLPSRWQLDDVDRCPPLSGSKKVMEPPVTSATSGRMPMIDWAMIDLPEPDSPTRATRLALGYPETDTLDDIVAAYSRSDTDPQILHTQQIRNALIHLTDSSPIERLGPRTVIFLSSARNFPIFAAFLVRCQSPF